MSTIKKIILSKNTTLHKHFENGSFEITIEPYSNVQLIHILENEDALNTQIHFKLSPLSSLHYYPIILSGIKSTIALTASLQNSSQLVINGGYSLSGQQECSFITKQDHKGVASVSSLILNGIVADSAFMNYQGSISIKKDATRSIAHQENKTLLLGSNAKAISIPSLEVQTNDVQCAHGSAVGQLQEECLLYAQSRGLPLETARKLLLTSFFAKTFKSMIDENLRNKIIDRLVCKALDDKGIV